MQRHFSNRGEALAEMAAAKMMAHRMPVAKSNQRRSSVTPALWKRPVPEIVSPSGAKKEGGRKENVTPSLAPPEL